MKPTIDEVKQNHPIWIAEHPSASLGDLLSYLLNLSFILDDESKTRRAEHPEFFSDQKTLSQRIARLATDIEIVRLAIETYGEAGKIDHHSFSS